MKLLPILFSIYSIILSVIFLPLYVGDDQYLYRLFYDSLQDLSFEDGYTKYREIVGASEPVYYVITYFLSNLLSKDILFSLINGILGYLLARLACKNNKKYLLFFMMSNFYIMALFLSHERLKIAIIFFLLVNEINNNKNYKYYLLSLLSHFQMIIPIAGNILLIFFDKKKYNINSNIETSNYKKIIFLILFLMIIYFFKENIIDKFIIYFESVNIEGVDWVFSVLKIAIFTIIGCGVTTRKKKVIIPNIVIMISAILVGSGRLVIFSYGYMMYYFIIRANYRQNIFFLSAIITINIYMSLKGLNFLYNIIDHGYGFE